MHAYSRTSDPGHGRPGRRPYMSCANLLDPNDRCVDTGTRMTPSESRTWPPLPSSDAGRAYIVPERPHQSWTADSSYYSEPRPLLRRCASALSLISPTPKNASSSTSFPSLSTDDSPSRQLHLGSFMRRRRDERTGTKIVPDIGQMPKRSAHTGRHQPTSAPQSAPSIVTTFAVGSAHWTSSGTSAPQHPSASAEQPKWYTSSNISTSSARNSFASWSEVDHSLRSTAVVSQSPTTYFSIPEPQSASRPYPVVGLGQPTSSATSSMRSSEIMTMGYATTASQPGHQRHGNAQEGFTSPSEFALFVEATSSLSLMPEDGQSSGGSETMRRSPPQLTTSRIAAPLPPLPRSHAPPPIDSSLSLPSGSQSLTLPSPAQPITLQRSVSQPPPPMANTVHRQRSARFAAQDRATHSQMLADALFDLGDDNDRNPDDELPDYETSQMEAHARKRWEAAQRARELDEAWRRARRTYS